MANNLVLTPESVDDITEAYSWYENSKKGLGTRFKAQVKRQIRAVQRRPLMHQIWQGVYRKSLVPKVPYIIIYGVQDSIVTIYAVAHTSRDMATVIQRKNSP